MWISASKECVRRVAVSSLADHCKSIEWSFLDNWNSFYCINIMFARDGFNHFSKGVADLRKVWKIHTHTHGEMRRVFS